MSVTRFTEFVAEEDGKKPKARTSLRVMYLVERVGDGGLETDPAQVGAELFAPGTTDKVVERPGLEKSGFVSSNTFQGVGYADYEKLLTRPGPEWQGVRLPEVKDKDKAVFRSVTFHAVQVNVKKADVRVAIGTAKGEKDHVLFKNVPIE